MNKILKAIVKLGPLPEVWRKRFSIVYFVLVFLLSATASVALGILSYTGAPGVVDNDKAIWVLGTVSGMFGMLALVIFMSFMEMVVKRLFKRFKKVAINQTKSQSGI